MFRFTIRDVLWLMVVVGLGAGWWVDRGLLAKSHRASVRWHKDRFSTLVKDVERYLITIHGDKVMVNEGDPPSLLTSKGEKVSW